MESNKNADKRLSTLINHKLVPDDTEVFALLLLGLYALLPLIMSFLHCLGLYSYFYGYLYIYEKIFLAIGFLLLLILILQQKYRRDGLLSAERLRKEPWIPLFAFIPLWSIPCAALSVDPRHAFLGTDYNLDGVLSLFLYGCFFLAVRSLKRERLRRRLLTLLAAASLPVALIVLAEGFGMPFFFEAFSDNSGHAACFTNSNHCGYYLCTAGAVLAGLIAFPDETASAREQRQQRTALSLFFGILVYAMLINDTLGSELGLVFAVLIMLPLFTRLSGRRIGLKALLPAIILLTLILLDCAELIPLGSARSIRVSLLRMGSDVGKVVSGSEDAAQAGSSRWGLWQHYFQCFLQHPLFGLGPEGLEQPYTIYLNYLRAHNEYLIVLSSLGLPGFLAYFGGLYSLCAVCVKRIRQLSPLALTAAVGVMGYLFSAFFGNQKFNIYPYFWILLGCLAAENTAESRDLPLRTRETGPKMPAPAAKNVK